MFDVSWSEMLLIVVVAVVAIGPKDLPRALHSAGKFIRKMKMITGDIQKSLERIMQEGELEEITRAANRAGGDNVQMMVERQLQKERAIPSESLSNQTNEATIVAPLAARNGDEELRYDRDEDDDALDALQDDMDAEEFIPRPAPHKSDKDNGAD